MNKNKKRRKKLLAYIYVRVSDPRQVENTSLMNQEESAQQKAIEEDFIPDKVFVEGGRSASKATSSRKEFHRMLAACEEHQDEVGAVIVWKYDRFARDIYDHYSVKRFLLSLGIRLISVLEPSNETIEGEIVEGVMATMARAESLNLSRRSKAGIMRIREQGRLSGPAPVGLLNVKHEEGKRTIKSVEHDQLRAPFIRRAFELFATGAYSKRQIVDKVNQMGFSMPGSGKKMQYSRLTEILRNPVYAGRIPIERGGDTWVRAEFPAIVQDALFDKVQRMLDESSAPTGKRRRVVHPDLPLKRTILCSVCGKPLTGGQSKGNGGKYFYYRCYNPDCYGLNERKEIIESRFNALLTRARLKPEVLSLFRETLREVWTKHQGDTDRELAMLSRRKCMLSEKNDRLVDLYCEGGIEKEEFGRKKNKYMDDLREVDQRLSAMATKQDEFEEYLNHAFEMIEKADILWQDSDIDARIRLQEALFPDGLMYDSEKGFLNPPMSKAFSLLEVLNAPEFDLVAGTGFEPATFGL